MRLLRTAAALALAVATAVAVASPAPALVPQPANDPVKVWLPNLRPQPARAYWDRPPVYDNGCHANRAATVAHFCRYGDPHGTKVVVAFGDSHVAQWWKSLDASARSEHWRLLWITKTACPAQDVSVRQWRSTLTYPACDVWRRSALAKIRALPRVDLVFMGGYAHHTLRKRGTNSVISGYQARKGAWQAGTERTVQALAGQVRRIMIVRDTPIFRFVVANCVRAHAGWTRVCSRDRASALSLGLWVAERAVAKKHSAWVRAHEFTDAICAPQRCWPVTSNRILRYRDDDHLTVTFTAAIANVVRWAERAAMR